MDGERIGWKLTAVMQAECFFFVGRCVRLGENPISDVARKQICETRTVREREYKVTVNC